MRVVPFAIVFFVYSVKLSFSQSNNKIKFIGLCDYFGEQELIRTRVVSSGWQVRGCVQTFTRCNEPRSNPQGACVG